MGNRRSCVSVELLVNKMPFRFGFVEKLWIEPWPIAIYRVTPESEKQSLGACFVQLVGNQGYCTAPHVFLLRLVHYLRMVLMIPIEVGAVSYCAPHKVINELCPARDMNSLWNIRVRRLGHDNTICSSTNPGSLVSHVSFFLFRWNINSSTKQHQARQNSEQESQPIRYEEKTTRNRQKTKPTHRHAHDFSKCCAHRVCMRDLKLLSVIEGFCTLFGWIRKSLTLVESSLHSNIFETHSRRFVGTCTHAINNCAKCFRFRALVMTASVLEP